MHVQEREYLSLLDKFQITGNIADVFCEIVSFDKGKTCWLLVEHKSGGQISDAVEQLSNTIQFINSKKHPCHHLVGVIEGKLTKNDRKMYSFKKPLKKDLEKYPDLKNYKEDKVLYIHKDKLCVIPGGAGNKHFILEKSFFNRAKVLMK